MSAELITTSQHCKRCGNSLTLEEMHYFEFEDGTATCNDCERKWMEEVDAWHRGELQHFPDQNK